MRIASCTLAFSLKLNPDLDSDKVLSYLRRYLLDRFNIEIYWGTPQQFMTELHAEWKTYSSVYDDDLSSGESWDDDDW